MVSVTGLMTTGTLCFHFTMSFWVSFWGSRAIFQAARTSLLLEENHYSIGTSKEKSFVGNYVSDSLHVTLAIITYSHCRQGTNSEICSVDETWMSFLCRKLTMMLPEGCVLYEDKMVFHLRFKSSARKVLKSEHWKILPHFIPCILFL